MDNEYYEMEQELKEEIGMKIYKKLCNKEFKKYSNNDDLKEALDKLLKDDKWKIEIGWISIKDCKDSWEDLKWNEYTFTLIIEYNEWEYIFKDCLISDKKDEECAYIGND